MDRESGPIGPTMNLHECPAVSGFTAEEAELMDVMKLGMGEGTDEPAELCGFERIAAERVRQINDEGYTPEQDDQYTDGGLVAAARCYLAAAASPGLYKQRPPASWRKSPCQWKPSDDPIRNLEKGGALVAAEIDRLLRRKALDLPPVDPPPAAGSVTFQNVAAEGEPDLWVAQLRNADGQVIANGPASFSKDHTERLAREQYQMFLTRERAVEEAMAEGARSALEGGAN
jgi:hypothetical protein